MLLTVSTRSSAAMPDAGDLGYLLHKHPGRVQSFDVAAGTAHVVWPGATPEQATAALIVDVDPVGLVRGRTLRGADGFTLSQYVNDRPYAASSLLAVALGKVFRTALSGRCEARPELVGAELPLTVHLPALPSRGGPDLAERLFTPLGWSVDATPIPLDPAIGAWGPSPYVDAHLSITTTVAAALSHLYVLLPVLDDAQHYWVGPAEVDKLLRAGSGWLGDHPERDLITRRYLRHQRDLVHSAVDRLTEQEPLPGASAQEPTDEPTRATPLVALRKAAVLTALRERGAARVVDLGCGEGALLREMLADPAFTRILGVDVSARALETAARRLQLDRLPERQRERLSLLQSSVTYRDDRLAGYDAIVLMEVIEHLDPPRLPALERSVFTAARPATVVVTTPNAEHNVRFPALAAGHHRHADHRFEFDRAGFAAWAQRVADAAGYQVGVEGIGADDPEVGPPTQLAVFTLPTSPAREAA